MGNEDVDRILHDDGWWHLISGINPQPWAVGPAGVARNGGKLRAYIGRNEQLFQYQQAVKEALQASAFPKIDGEVALRFYLWRQIEQKDLGAGRKTSANRVDATNMQKALEDALQGIFYVNDRLVRKVMSEVVDQGPNVTPLILVHVRPWVGLDPNEIPDFIWNRIDEQPTLLSDKGEANAWDGEGMF